MRAATLLATLERYLGEPAWSRIMRTYHMRFRYRHPTKDDFVDVVEEVSGRDMDWFFERLLEGTETFDYGVGSLASVKEPVRRRGVYDLDKGRVEVTDKTVAELEKAGENAPEGSRPEPVYRTTVVLRRYGEARLGGDASVKVIVRFKDGSVETRAWDGQTRWTRLEFLKPARAESAQIDPDGVWLVDANLANNSRGVDGLRRNVIKLMTQLLFTVQTFLHYIGSWS